MDGKKIPIVKIPAMTLLRKSLLVLSLLPYKLFLDKSASEYTQIILCRLVKCFFTQKYPTLSTYYFFWEFWYVFHSKLNRGKEITSLIPGLTKTQNSNSTFSHASQWYSDVWTNVKFELNHIACILSERGLRWGAVYYPLFYSLYWYWYMYCYLLKRSPLFTRLIATFVFHCTVGKSS